MRLVSCKLFSLKIAKNHYQSISHSFDSHELLKTWGNLTNLTSTNIYFFAIQFLTLRMLPYLYNLANTDVHLSNVWNYYLRLCFFSRCLLLLLLLLLRLLFLSRFFSCRRLLLLLLLIWLSLLLLFSDSRFFLLRLFVSNIFWFFSTIFLSFLSVLDCLKLSKFLKLCFWRTFNCLVRETCKNSFTLNLIKHTW